MRKKVNIVKNMNKNEVNALMDGQIKLMDDIFMGHKYKHNWECNCGNTIEGRTLDNIFRENRFKCKDCRINKIKAEHKKTINNIDDYEYIASYLKGDIMQDGTTANRSCVEVRHKYCNNTSIKEYNSFVKTGKRCSKCCKTYENSFAYHIEQELGEPLEKYWDFEKNTVNPYHIWKSTPNKKVWIKCRNEEINELNGLMKKDYHPSYEISCNNFNNGKRCNYCCSRKIHIYDSFGYSNPAVLSSFSEHNDSSPFNISIGSNKDSIFICQRCEREFIKKARDIKSKGLFCSRCSRSEGEIRIENYMQNNNIEYIPQKEFVGLIGTGGGNLSYDFYLPNCNLLIEYQGEFHDGNVRCQSAYELEYQQEHDRRKRKYSKDNNINLLEIWYWDFDNIEEILDKELINYGKIIK